jgi:hypothetical protein
MPLGGTLFGMQFNPQPYRREHITSSAAASVITIDVNQCVKEAVNSIKREEAIILLNRSLNIQERYAENLPRVRINNEDLRWALKEIIINAIDFSPFCSKVSVITHLEKKGRGKRALIIISDYGRGIDADNIAQSAIKLGIIDSQQAQRMTFQEKINLVFEKNVTTRKTLKGGAGLAFVKTEVEKAGGNVEVFSAPNSGTSIVISLPEATEKYKIMPLNEYLRRYGGERLIIDGKEFIFSKVERLKAPHKRARSVIEYVSPAARSNKFVLVEGTPKKIEKCYFYEGPAISIHGRAHKGSIAAQKVSLNKIIDAVYEKEKIEQLLAVVCNRENGSLKSASIPSVYANAVVKRPAEKYLRSISVLAETTGKEQVKIDRNVNVCFSAKGWSATKGAEHLLQPVSSYKLAQASSSAVNTSGHLVVIPVHTRKRSEVRELLSQAGIRVDGTLEIGFNEYDKEITRKVQEYVKSVNAQKITTVLYGQAWRVCLNAALFGIALGAFGVKEGDPEKKAEILIPFDYVENMDQKKLNSPNRAYDDFVRSHVFNGKVSKHALTLIPHRIFIYGRQYPGFAGRKIKEENASFTVRIFRTTAGMIEYLKQARNPRGEASSSSSRDAMQKVIVAQANIGSNIHCLNLSARKHNLILAPLEFSKAGDIEILDRIIGGGIDGGKYYLIGEGNLGAILIARIGTVSQYAVPSRLKETVRRFLENLRLAEASAKAAGLGVFKNIPQCHTIAEFIPFVGSQIKDFQAALDLASALTSMHLKIPIGFTKYTPGSVDIVNIAMSNLTAKPGIINEIRIFYEDTVASSASSDERNHKKWRKAQEKQLKARRIGRNRKRFWGDVFPNLPAAQKDMVKRFVEKRKKQFYRLLDTIGPKATSREEWNDYFFLVLEAAENMEDNLGAQLELFEPEFPVATADSEEFIVNPDMIINISEEGARKNGIEPGKYLVDVKSASRRALKKLYNVERQKGHNLSQGKRYELAVEHVKDGAGKPVYKGFIVVINQPDLHYRYAPQELIKLKLSKPMAADYVYVFNIASLDETARFQMIDKTPLSRELYRQSKLTDNPA